MIPLIDYRMIALIDLKDYRMIALPRTNELTLQDDMI